MPAKPTGLTTRVEILLTRERARFLHWDLAADPSILRYEYTTDEGRTWSPLATFIPADNAQLPPEEFLSGYTFRIRAVNGAGPGPVSEPAVEEEVATAARAHIQSASLEWDATTRKATLVWDQTALGARLGGSADLLWWWIHFDTSVHRDAANAWHADLPIRPGTTRYEYEIPATFNAGDPIAVSISACENPRCSGVGILAGRVPDLRFEAGGPITAPTGFSATPGDAQITLAWDDPMDSSITHFEYEVRRGGRSASGHNDIPDGADADMNAGNETSHTVTAIYNAFGVTDGTAPVNGDDYGFRLRAANANGAGPWTPEVRAIPLAAGVPAAPSGVVELTGGGDAGLTTWDDPQDPSITAYQLSTSDGWVDIPGTDATTTGVNERLGQLRAVNANGAGPVGHSTLVYSPAPARPTGLQAAPGNGRVTLTWDDPGKDVYIEFYRYTTDGGDTWPQIPNSQSTVQGQFTRYTVPDLTNGQAYTFAILAENDTGTSPVSAGVTATPQGGAPAKPTGLSAAPGNAEATLTWDDPQDPSITKYQVKQGAANWADISGSRADTTSHTVGTLTNGTAYTFQIRAVNDHNGDNTDDPGPATDAVTIRPGVPTAPASLSVLPGDAQATLTWTAPASDGGSAVTGYEYTSDADAATPTWTDVPDGSDSGNDRADETEYAVTSLVNNTTYAFAVRAENDNGQGPATPTLRATPVPPGTPQRPGGLRATPGHELVKLKWALPHFQHPVTSYQYRQSTDGGTSWNPDWTAVTDSDATTTEHLLTGLANGTAYTFELRALKDSTAGPSARAQATPSRTAADEVIDRGSSGQLTTPTGSKYTVTRLSRPSVHNWRIAVPGDTDIDGHTFIVSSLQGGTPETSPRYAFTSTGQEGLDIKVLDDRREEVRLQAKVCLEPGPNSPLRREAGSQPLLVLHYSGTGWTRLPTTTDGGMVCGATSNFSAFVLGYEAADAGGAAAKPTGLSAAPRDAKVRLTWDNPHDASITKYQVKQDAAAWADISGSDAGTTRHTVRGLSNGTLYTFRIRAVNDHDDDGADDPGPASDAVTVRAGVPAAPASLEADAGDTQVTLTWTPASDNGSPVTGYEYTSTADAATPAWKDVPDSGSKGRADETEYTVTNLVNNATYAFAVRAENAYGQGPATPTLRATPLHPDAPQRPAGLRATPGDKQVKLAWTPPDVHRPVTSYQYRQSTDGGTTWSPDWTAITGSGAATAEHLLTGLTNGRTYTFELRALNGSTAGPSARVQATPRGPRPPETPPGTNAEPEAAQRLSPLTVRAGETSEPLDLTPYFDDPDGDSLTYTAVSDDPGVAIADLPRGSNWLVLRGVADGEAVVVVTARDPDGAEASQSLTVTVRTVAAPEAAQSLPPQTLLVGETSEPLDLTPYFDDPDGDPLTFTAVSYDDAVLVAEVAEGSSQLTLRAVAAGEAVVVVTARDPDGAETILPMTVTVRTNAAPEAARPLPTQTLLVGETSEPLDLTRYFHDPDGDPLTFAAVWGSDASVAIAEVAEGGSQLTLRGVGAGEARILVTARDPDGEKARQSLTVTVRTNAAPEVAQPIPTRTMLVDTTSEPLDLTPYFHDPDGDPLTFAAVSYDDAVLVAEVAEGGSQLTLRAVAAGEAVVVVTARDPLDAEAGQSLALTVRTNAAPEAAQPLPTQTVLVDTTTEPLDLAPYFHDPDGDPLTYAAVSDDDAVLVAELAEGGSELTLRGVAAGEAVVVVTARDPFDAEASQPMTVTVRTNAAPEVAQPLPTQTMLAGTASEPLDLTPYFHDPDGDPLTYAAVSDNAGVAVAELAEGGNELTLRAVGAGEAVVVVTARDPFDAEASQPMTLTVRTNAAPETAQPLPTQTVLAGTASEPLDLTPYFHDPDGDPLTYAAVSANAEVATAGVVGDLFTLTGVAAGTVVVTVTARDPHDGEASQTVIVTVTAVHADWVKAWAARFGRTVSGHVLDGVQERLRVAPRPGFQATLGGHQLGGISEEASRELGDWQLGGPAAFQRELELLAGLTDDEQMSNGAPQQASTARDLFTSSAFSLTVGNAEEGSSGFGALWGRGAVSRFDGREGPLSLTGEVATGMVGIDWISRRWRTGLALAMSRGIGGYSAGVNSGEIESKLTGLFPWVGYDVTDRVSVWATAGYGAGVLTFTPENAEAMTAELALSMVAAGARSELLKLRQLGGVMLALETDTRLTRTTTGAIAGLEATEASVWQRRLGLEGSRPVALGGRLSLRPSVEVGLRYDGGDAETGAGMDVGAGLGFSDSGTGLAVDVHVRTLLVHEAEGFSERGVAFSLSYDPTPSTPLGVTARVAPSWGGQAQSGAAALWGRETMVGMAHGGAAQGYRLNGEVGYGLPVGGRFVGTPRVGFARSEHSRDYRVGYGLGVLETGSLHVEVGVDALRSESPLAGGASNALRGQASLGW